MLKDVLLQTFVFLPLVYGVYLSYYILRIPDLTVESSFVTGAVVFTRALEKGFSPLVAVVLGLCGGMVVGLGVSLLQIKERIPPLISGILMLFMMYPLNLLMLSRPNASLLYLEHLFNWPLYSTEQGYLMIIFGVGIFLTVVLWLGLESRFGLMLRALGVNVKLFQLLGKKGDVYRSIGLMISNLLAGLSGVMTALLNGYTDVNMGVGMALIGIGVVIIGHHLKERFSSKPSFLQSLLFCMLAAAIYFMGMHICLFFGLNPVYLKIVMAALLIALLLMQPNQIITRKEPT